SISLLEMQGLEPTGKELDFMINPGRPIPQESTKIHGINDNDVKDSPVLMEILPEVIEFIDHAVIIGHHIAFDLRFLNRALLKTAWCRLNNIVLDTMVMYLGYSSRLGHYTLDDVAKACGVEIKHRHTAAGDTKATAEIFCVLAKRLCPDGCTLKTLVHSHSGAQEDF
ncbi:MAG: 3'-5' exonuclease, partial [Gammaproteobacteria bacterium]